MCHSSSVQIKTQRSNSLDLLPFYIRLTYYHATQPLYPNNLTAKAKTYSFIHTYILRAEKTGAELTRGQNV